MLQEPPLVVYVDIDDTLVRTVGTTRIPIPATIAHVRALYDQGAVLYCWSAGGAAYAEQSAEALGIAACFNAFLPKPQVLLDDQLLADWRRLLQVHPNACVGETVESYRRRRASAHESTG